MLRNPELRDAFESLKSIPIGTGDDRHTHILLSNLRSTTLLLLRALDSLAAYSQDNFANTQDALRETAHLIQKALTSLDRN